MSHETSMQRIAHWLDRGEEPLQYAPDCGPYWASPQASPQASPLPNAKLAWPEGGPLGLPSLDASEA